MLKIEHLTKIYGEKKAVDDLSLYIRPGEIYGTGIQFLNFVADIFGVSAAGRTKRFPSSGVWV